MKPDIIGWISSVILVATLVVQVHKQYKTQTIAGVSQWLYWGELAASGGFAIYSVLLHNWVFTVTNGFGLLSGIAGTLIFYRNRRRLHAEGASPRYTDPAIH